MDSAAAPVEGLAVLTGLVPASSGPLRSSHHVGFIVPSRGHARLTDVKPSTSSEVRPPAPRHTRAQLRARGMRRLKGSRRIVQLVFAAWIVVAAVRHQLSRTSGETASVDALCPFGAVETLITWINTGHFISKIHQSNLILGLAVLAATLLVGNVFCGWICPFGAVQDALSWVSRKAHLPQLTIPARCDRVLRYGRYVVLAVVLYFSVSTTKLWFSDYDPYVTLFGLGWLFEFNFSTMWIGLALLVLILGGSLLVERTVVPVPLPARRSLRDHEQVQPATDPSVQGRVYGLHAVQHAVPGRDRAEQGQALRQHRLHRLPRLRRRVPGEGCAQGRRARCCWASPSCLRPSSSHPVPASVSAPARRTRHEPPHLDLADRLRRRHARWRRRRSGQRRLDHLRKAGRGRRAADRRRREGLHEPAGRRRRARASRSTTWSP